MLTTINFSLALINGSNFELQKKKHRELLRHKIETIFFSKIVNDVAAFVSLPSSSKICQMFFANRCDIRIFAIDNIFEKFKLLQRFIKSSKMFWQASYFPYFGNWPTKLTTDDENMLPSILFRATIGKQFLIYCCH